MANATSGWMPTIDRLGAPQPGHLGDGAQGV